MTGGGVGPQQRRDIDEHVLPGRAGTISTGLSPQQGAHPVDDVARALIVLADVVEDRADFVEVRRFSWIKSAAASALRRMAPSGWLISCASAEASWPITETRPTWAMSCRRRSISCSACLREVKSMRRRWCGPAGPRVEFDAAWCSDPADPPSGSSSRNSPWYSPSVPVVDVKPLSKAVAIVGMQLAQHALQVEGLVGEKPNSSRHWSLAMDLVAPEVAAEGAQVRRGGRQRHLPLAFAQLRDQLLRVQRSRNIA